MSAAWDTESSCKGNSDPLHSLKSVHVSELYLARRQLTDVPDLSRFTQLRYIWLNNNRIKNFQGLVFHCCLAELYLQNNEITSIAGALRHLHCLRVLLLHNNHLHNLQETVAELRNMQHLQTLKVRQKEKRHAFKLFSPERQTILDTLAFGRRTPEQRRSQDKQRGQWSSKTKCPFDEIKDLCERMAKQSTWFSTLDRSNVREAQQHPLEEQSLTAGTTLAVKFR